MISTTNFFSHTPESYLSLLVRDFGTNIAKIADLSCAQEVYQIHYEYYQALKSALNALTELGLHDISLFLEDANLGNGELQLELFDLLLTKNNVEEAYFEGLLQTVVSRNTVYFEKLKEFIIARHGEDYLNDLMNDSRTCRLGFMPVRVNEMIAIASTHQEENTNENSVETTLFTGKFASFKAFFNSNLPPLEDSFLHSLLSTPINLAACHFLLTQFPQFKADVTRNLQNVDLPRSYFASITKQNSWGGLFFILNKHSCLTQPSSILTFLSTTFDFNAQCLIRTSDLVNDNPLTSSVMHRSGRR